MGQAIGPIAMRACWLAVFCAAFCNSAWAADASWLTGESLHAALAQKTLVVWSNISLRQALAELSVAKRVAIVLDRRIDPGQRIEYSIDNVPLEEGLQGLAARLQIGVTLYGPIVYFGPASTTDYLRTIAALRTEEAKQLPIQARMPWLREKAWKWDDLAKPRELLQAAAKDAGVQIEGLEKVPADLWYRADLPPLTLPLRLTLVLAQFDLTYEPAADGASIRLVAVPEKPTIEQRYAANTLTPALSQGEREKSGSNAPLTQGEKEKIAGLQELAAKVQQTLGKQLSPDAEISVDGAKLLVRGREEDQLAVRELLSGKTVHRTAVTEGQDVYTLEPGVEVPVRKLLDALGPRLGMEIHVDEPAIKSAGLSLDKAVKVDVKRVSVDELLKAVLEPAGLTFTRDGKVVEVKVKANSAQ